MKHSGVKATAFTNPFIRAQLTGEAFPKITNVLRGTIEDTGKRRLRQDTKGPNKSELALIDYAKRKFTGADIRFEALTIKLANGSRYTPDVYVRTTEGQVLFLECKGLMRDDAAAKIKFAAAEFPIWEFYLFTKNGRAVVGWDIQRILS